ncbi:MAG: hypothetical protein ACK5LS_02695 [Propioniciclava sp.]
MTTAPGDDALLAAVRAGWERWDPPPADLSETILVALAMEEVDDDYALLTLVQRSHQLVGARNDRTDRVLIEFRSGALTVLVRVTQDDPDGLRLDGWVTPAGGGTVTITQGDATRTATLDEQGRFTLPVATHGLSRLVVATTDAASEAPASEFRTTLFEI